MVVRLGRDTSGPTARRGVDGHAYLLQSAHGVEELLEQCLFLQQRLNHAAETQYGGEGGHKVRFEDAPVRRPPALKPLTKLAGVIMVRGGVFLPVTSCVCICLEWSGTVTITLDDHLTSVMCAVASSCGAARARTTQTVSMAIFKGSKRTCPADSTDPRSTAQASEPRVGHPSASLACRLSIWQAWRPTRCPHPPPSWRLT